MSVICCHSGRVRIKASMNCPKACLSSTVTMVNRVQFPQFRVSAEHSHGKAVRKEFSGDGAVPIAQSGKERFAKLQKGRRRQREVSGQTDIEDMAQLVKKHTLRRGMLVPQDARQKNITGDRVVVEKIGDAKGVISAVPTV